FLGAGSIDEARKLDAIFIRDKYAEWMRGGFRSVGATSPMIGSITDNKLIVGPMMDMMLENKRQMCPLLMGNTPIEFIAEPAGCETEEDLEKLIRNTFSDKNAEKLIELDRADTLEEMKKNATYNPVELGVRCVLERTIEDENAPDCWYYQFDVDMPGEDHPGPFHSSDLWFTFASLAVCWRPFTGKHYDLARLMCNYWSNFIKCGDPNGKDVDGTDMPRWLSYRESRSPMYFAETAEMKGLEMYSPQMQVMVDDCLGR
ncbi:MAG: carboxylesterase family protein, partial [Bacillota bacterium]